MSRSLDGLASYFRPLACELIARSAEIGVALLIVDTDRTLVEQNENLAKGVSWTLNSKHLPQPPEGKSEAIDVCLYESYQLHGSDKLQWNASDPVWAKIGEIGRDLGLKWGVWKVDSSGNLKNIDPGHFEYVHPEMGVETSTT